MSDNMNMCGIDRSASILIHLWDFVAFNPNITIVPGEPYFMRHNSVLLSRSFSLEQHP